MAKIMQPTKEELTPFFLEATAEQPPTEWMEKMLRNIHDILRKRPLRYRTYGPYWWPLKKILISHGYSDFGLHVDHEWADDLSYGDEAYDLLAAWAYEEGRFSSGHLIESPYHVVTLADGDGLDFASQDQDMEILAVAIAMQR